jgi:hypothetical protein
MGTGWFLNFCLQKSIEGVVQTIHLQAPALRDALTLNKVVLESVKQCFGSGLDPDSIRSVDPSPDPDPDPGGQKYFIF